MRGGEKTLLEKMRDIMLCTGDVSIMDSKENRAAVEAEYERLYGGGMKPTLNKNNIAMVSERTMYPIPLAYYYPFILGSGIDEAIEYRPRNTSMKYIREMFSAGELEVKWYTLLGKKYKVTMVHRVLSSDFLVCCGLSGIYCTDLFTSMRLMELGVGFQTPYRYKFTVGGRKDYSPVCCLTESFNNTYMMDYSQLCVPAYPISTVIGYLKKTSWNSYIDGFIPDLELSERDYGLKFINEMLDKYEEERNR